VTVRLLLWTCAVLRHRRTVAACAVCGAGLATAVTIVHGVEYTAESSYVPHMAPYMRGSGSIQLTALVGRFGVRIPYSEAGEQPKFYEDLVTSRTILTEIARAGYRFPVEWNSPDSLEGDLLELFAADGESEAERLAATLDRLSGRVSADMDLLTGIVMVRTRAPWPGLAEQMNRKILQSIQDFIFLKRREKYLAMHEFAGSRAQVARQELAKAEDALLEFHTRNRRYDNSPLLVMEEQRIRDELERRIQLHVSLLLAEEEARIENRRDTPFITVIDSPEHGAYRSGPRLPVTIPLGFLVGGILGMSAAVAVDSMTRGHRS